MASSNERQSQNEGVLPAEVWTGVCGWCGGEAYRCDRPHHGAATWAIHCRSAVWHNLFSTDAAAQNTPDSQLPSPTLERQGPQ